MRDELTFLMPVDDTDVYNMLAIIAKEMGLTEQEAKGESVLRVRFSRPAPIQEVDPPPFTPSEVWSEAPYLLASPTKIRFNGEVFCYTAPNFSARKLSFTDNRTVDVWEERGDWWCVHRKTLPSGQLFELWIPRATFVLKKP